MGTARRKRDDRSAGLFRFLSAAPQVVEHRGEIEVVLRGVLLAPTTRLVDDRIFGHDCSINCAISNNHKSVVVGELT